MNLRVNCFLVKNFISNSREYRDWSVIASIGLVTRSAVILCQKKQVND